MARLFVVSDLLACHGVTLLHGGELGHALGDAQNLVFADDQILFAIEFHLGAGVLPDQHVLTRLHVQWDGFAVIVHATAASRDDFGLLWLFLGGIRDDDAADALFLLFNPLHQDTITQRSYVHGYPPFWACGPTLFYPLAPDLMSCQAYDLSSLHSCLTMFGLTVSVF